MKNKIILYIMMLMLYMSVFCIPAYAFDGGEPETLTVNAAWLDGELLRIEVTDADGVDSALAIRLSDYLSGTENSEYISIQAVDFDGNASGIIEIKNPYYSPSALTPTPAGDAGQPSETTQSAVSQEMNPFTPDGTGTVMDNATDGDGKEFLTITTEDENVFYLIIDRQKNSENVYLLNAVTEDDLMALAQKSGNHGTTDNNDSTSAIPTTEPAPQTPSPAPDQEPEKTIAPSAGNNSAGATAFIVFAVLIVGGAGYYFKIYKPKKHAPDIDDDDDMDYEDELEETDENATDYDDETEETDENAVDYGDGSEEMEVDDGYGYGFEQDGEEDI